MCLILVPFNPGLNPGLCTQFVGGNKASLDGVNEYRLEAYATLLFGASSDHSRSCGGHAEVMR